MTTAETTALIDRHLTGWLGSDAPEPTLRDRIAAMIAEAIAGRDKLFADGQETMRHEWNVALAKLRAVEAAASFDPAQDRDLETCVRRLYHSEAAHRGAFADAVKACSFMQDEQDELWRYGMRLGHRTTVEGIEALRRHRNELRDHLAAMTTARDDAVQAAHLAVEESERLRRLVEDLHRYNQHPGL